MYKLALCNLWSGVMEWSLGVEPWSGVFEWILEWNPKSNDGQMPMEYRGLPWLSMVIQPWLTMVDHVLLNGRPWLTMV